MAWSIVMDQCKKEPRSLTVRSKTGLQFHIQVIQKTTPRRVAKGIFLIRKDILTNLNNSCYFMLTLTNNENINT